jgi:hypothetical protein
MDPPAHPRTGHTTQSQKVEDGGRFSRSDTLEKSDGGVEMQPCQCHPEGTSHRPPERSPTCMTSSGHRLQARCTTRQRPTGVPGTASRHPAKGRDSCAVGVRADTRPDARIRLSICAVARPRCRGAQSPALAGCGRLRNGVQTTPRREPREPFASLAAPRPGTADPIGRACGRADHRCPARAADGCAIVAAQPKGSLRMRLRTGLGLGFCAVGVYGPLRTSAGDIARRAAHLGERAQSGSSAGAAPVPGRALPLCCPGNAAAGYPYPQALTPVMRSVASHLSPLVVGPDHSPDHRLLSRS